MQSSRLRRFAAGLFGAPLVGLLCACGVSDSASRAADAQTSSDAPIVDAAREGDHEEHVIGEDAPPGVDAELVDAGFVDAGCIDGAVPSGLGEPFLCADAGDAMLSCSSRSEYCFEYGFCLPLPCACGAYPTCECLALPTPPYTCEDRGGGILVRRFLGTDTESSGRL